MKARILIVMVGMAAIAAALPTYYYMPAYEGGACTVRTIIYKSVVANTTLPGKKVLLAKEPGVCKINDESDPGGRYECESTTQRN